MDRDETILATLAKADAMAGAFYRRRTRFADLDDLRGEARLAVVKAFERFDPSRGKAFTSYAHTRITGALQDLHRREDFLSRADRKRAGHTRDVLTQFAEEDESAGLAMVSIPSPYLDPEEMLLASNASPTQEVPQRKERIMPAKRQPTDPPKDAEPMATLHIPVRVLDALLVAQPVDQKIKMMERLLLEYAGL